MENVGIYKIISPSGKIYIGQSTDLKSRKRGYSYIKNKTQIKIYNSLKKYGWNKHIFEVIENCPKSQLDDREEHHKIETIKKVGIENVLFCKIRDSKGGHLSEEIKMKIGKSHLGKKRSEETKLKMSISATGRKYSDQDKIKISEGKKGKKIVLDKRVNMKGKRCLPILQCDLNNKFIKEWSSFKEITENMGFHNSALVNCCKGRQLTSKGYIWKYKL